MIQSNQAYSWVSIIFLILIIVWAFYDQRPSLDHLDDEPHKDFSVEKVYSHLKAIAKEPHYVGTPAHEEVKKYLFDQLKELGLNPQIQTQRVFQLGLQYGKGAVVKNIIARIKGRKEGKALMLMAHYDSAIPHALGASDAGSGVAVILEGLRIFMNKKQIPRNDIIILFTDAEEYNLGGARAFIEKHPWANDIGVILNFEARGSGGISHMLMETNGKNNKMVAEFVKADPSYPVANSMSYSFYKMIPNYTDLTPFREIADIDGYFFAFIDDHFDYHTSEDIWQRLDRVSVIHQGDYMMHLLNYFANSDINNLKGDYDEVFFRFPIAKLVHYPASWNTILFGIATSCFVVLLVIGIRKDRINPMAPLEGFVPILASLIGNMILSYGLWQFLQFLHPWYNDLQQGFTYNGYFYIAAFTALNIAVTLLIYEKWLLKYKASELFIAPIALWLILNLIFLIYVPGGAFLTILVAMALIILAILTFTDINVLTLLIILLILSFPALYILAPNIKFTTVTLGLELLAGGTFWTVMLMGVLIPFFAVLSVRKPLRVGMGVVSVALFILASFNSGFTDNRKKPNNITFYYNADNQVSYWASRNHSLDSFLRQFLGDKPNTGPLPENANFHNSIRYYSKTTNRNIEVAKVTLQKDTVTSSERTIEFIVAPRKSVHRIILRTREDISINKMAINGTMVCAIDYDGLKLERKANNSILHYIISDIDTVLNISMTIEKSITPSFYLEEISYDLLSSELFDFEPRSNDMMPFPYYKGSNANIMGADAIITKKTVNFGKLN